MLVKRIATLLGVFFVATSAMAMDAEVLGKKKIDFGTSEPDAKIYVNGKMLGKGSIELVVPSNDCITVVVKKVGFLTEKIEYCNTKNMPKPPKTDYVELRRDDSFDASIQTDIANVGIELKSTIPKDRAWKLINQIVLSYIDVIEMTDKETGYIRTAWSQKTFIQNTVRTRVIVKEVNDDPLTFKVKLVSEASGMPMTSVKNDELFKEWDRVLRSYSGMIPELQARIK
ncbi:hypothetical protein [Sediminicola luteus]|uniref:PEGA domain-containing protein n=1 Tax=Sediminicola luteus TaxID=319238 RepID=A0A2A4GET0_9FLAO|nr:hypothetical protein [Sediminicola luteus]PCE66295.1 hypothetical protein B7P33_03070 [Sediminicola luteus]